MRKRPSNLSVRHEILNRIDYDLPLKLKFLEPVFDRMALQYPAASKYQMVIIVKSFLEEIRKQLLLGNAISILGFVSDMSLRAGARISRFNKNKLLYLIRLRSNTPENLR